MRLTCRPQVEQCCNMAHGTEGMWFLHFPVPANLTLTWRSHWPGAFQPSFSPTAPGAGCFPVCPPPPPKAVLAHDTYPLEKDETTYSNSMCQIITWQKCVVWSYGIRFKQPGSAEETFNNFEILSHPPLTPVKALFERAVDTYSCKKQTEKLTASCFCQVLSKKMPIPITW